jgi:hypothetical protein
MVRDRNRLFSGARPEENKVFMTRWFEDKSLSAGRTPWVRRPKTVGKTITVILPDAGERSLSAVLFEGVFDTLGVAA